MIPALQASTSWNVIGPFFRDISGTQQGISVDTLKGTPIDLGQDLKALLARKAGRAEEGNRADYRAR